MSIFDFFKGLTTRDDARPVETDPPSQPVAGPPVVPAPEANDPSGPSDIDAEIGDTIEEIFANEPAEGMGVTTAAGEDYDQAAVGELFAEIAANQARPVKDMILELRRGSGKADWIEVCRPIMTTLIRSADSMGLSVAAKKMMDFDETLSLVSGTNGPLIEPATGNMILSSYDEMARALPRTFELENAEERRDGILIHSLLKQVSGVGHVTFERLFEAGLTTTEALLDAPAKDLAAATGIPGSLCERIEECFRDYARRQGLHTGEDKMIMRLDELVRDLRGEHEELERTTNEEWSDPSYKKNKRDCRKRREHCALQIEVLLADLGELALVSRIQEMPIGSRIEALEAFLADRSAATAEA